MTEAVTPRLGVGSTAIVLFRDQTSGVIFDQVDWADQTTAVAYSEPIDVLGFNNIGIDMYMQEGNCPEGIYFTVSVQTSLSGIVWINVPDSAYSVPPSGIHLVNASTYDALHIDLQTTTHFVRIIVTCNGNSDNIPVPVSLQGFIALEEA